MAATTPSSVAYTDIIVPYICGGFKALVAARAQATGETPVGGLT
jgi:hypothetical protein